MIKTNVEISYSVKEVANQFHISEHTVRYYTDAGLIPTLKRDKNNNRVFDQKSIDWLSTVLCFRNCGMSIEDIKKYEELCLMGDNTMPARYEIILKQKKIAQEAFEQAKRTLDFVNYKVDYYRKVLNGTQVDYSNPYNW